MSCKCRNVKIGLQAGTDRTLYATWSYPDIYLEPIKKLDHFEYRWYYSTGDNVGYIGQEGETSGTAALTYNAPQNATAVSFSVRSIAAEGQTDIRTGKKIPWYTNDDWTSRAKGTAAYFAFVDTPEKIATPTVSIDKLKLTASLTNIDKKDITYVRFEVVRDGKTLHKRTSWMAVNAYNNVSYTCSITAGYNYTVRAQGKRAGIAGEWSDFSAASGTIPKAVSKIEWIKALSETSVQMQFPDVANATKYTIQYTTKTMYFDSNMDEVKSHEIDAAVASHAEITGMETGNKYYFRIRAENDQGASAWYPLPSANSYPSIVLGSIPEPPTTWSSTSTAITGEPVTIYWVHNSEDGSDLTNSIIRYYLKGVAGSEKTITLGAQGEAGDTQSYTFSTTGYEEGANLVWSVRTRGVLKTGGKFNTGYSDYATYKSITVNAPPTLSLSLLDVNNKPFDYLTSFPFYISATAGPDTQTPIGYHVDIIANSAYETVDNLGNPKLISKGDIVYSQYYDTTNDLLLELSAGSVNLDNNINYTVKCTVSMDSGLTATESAEFTVGWSDISYEPDVAIGVDEDTLSAVLMPYCQDEEGNRVEGVLLSVYRRNYDGTFTEIATNVSNQTATYILDPHPALDYARYRVTITEEATGAVSYTDVVAYPIQEKSVVLQWDEAWTDYAIYEDKPEEPQWAGSLLKIPYNIDVSDSHSSDVALVEYIGRKHPVSYYGTQVGATSTWSMEIPKSDKETLYALRRLAVWMGDVYVREPSGSGYWANISVSFDQKHCELTIPITLDITRVEGGI